EIVLAADEIGLEAEIAFDLLFDSGNVLRLGQLEDRLGVVGHRAVAIDGDVDRPHAEEAEGHEAESKNGADTDGWLSLDQLNHHQVVEALEADEIGPAHQPGDEHALPKSAEIAGHDAGENGERRAALA